MTDEIAVEHGFATADQHSTKVQKVMNEQIWNEVEGQMDHVKLHSNRRANGSTIAGDHRLVPMFYRMTKEIDAHLVTMQHLPHSL